MSSNVPAPAANTTPEVGKPMTVGAVFAKHQKQIASVLPAHISAERMLRIALNEIKRTPGLAECTIPSLLGAVLTCSQLGLEPGPHLGHAYLIPFNNKVKLPDGTTRYEKSVQLVIGYRGMIDLARRSGQVISLTAHAVYENDDFKFEYGLNEDLSHVPASGDRGPITHFYGICMLKGGGHQFVVMSRDDVEKIMENHTQSKGKWGPWKDNFEEMGKKTVIRRLFKYLPISVEIQQMTVHQESVESGIVPDNPDIIFDAEDYEVADTAGNGEEHASKSDELAAKLAKDKKGDEK